MKRGINKDAENTEIVVLGVGATALAVARCLKAAGIGTTVVSHPNISLIASYSRSCRLRNSPYGLNQDDELCGWLLANFPSNRRKILLPENDSAALFIAKWSARLKPSFLIWGNKLETLMNLVSKDNLMRQAELAGISVPRSISNDDRDKTGLWAEEVEGPYIIKPLYSGAPRSSLRGVKKKNWIIETKPALLELLEDSVDSSLIIQKYLQAGDGNVFDCYGLCDSDGHVATAATHKRIREL